METDWAVQRWCRERLYKVFSRLSEKWMSSQIINRKRSEAEKHPCSWDVCMNCWNCLPPVKGSEDIILVIDAVIYVFHTCTRAEHQSWMLFMSCSLNSAPLSAPARVSNWSYFDSEPVKHLLFFLNSHKHTLTELAQFPPHQRLCRNIRPLARC